MKRLLTNRVGERALNEAWIEPENTEIAWCLMSRKRKQRTVASYDHYPVRIHGWEVDYDLSLNTNGIFGSLRMQPIASILTALQSDKIQYVIFRGEALRYGSASIQGVTFSKEYDPEDY